MPFRVSVPARLVAVALSALAIAVSSALAPAVTAGAAGPVAPRTPVWTSQLAADTGGFTKSTGGWGGAAGTSLVWTTNVGHALTGALAIKNVGSSAGYVGAQSAASPSDGVPVTPGTRVRATAWFRSAKTSRQATVAIAFYKANGKKITAVGGQVMSDTTAWRQPRPTIAIAPDGAAYALVSVVIGAVAPGETHYVDDVMLATTPGSSPDVVGPLHVSGNRIIDGRGSPLTVRGFNVEALDADPKAAPTTEEIAAAKSWGANMLRIDLGAQYWLSTSCEYAASYANSVDQVVRDVTNRGMIALLDLHVLAPSSCGTTAREVPMPEATQGVDFWQQVAARYMDNPLVAFDLYNEPNNITPHVWLNGGPITSYDDSYQATGMQQMYDAVRGTGANNLTFVSGIDWADNPSPLRVSGTNIVYSGHIYTCMTDLPPDCTYPNPTDPTSRLTVWNSLATSVPFVITEFGYPNAADGTFNAAVIAYAEAHGWGWLQHNWQPGTWGPFNMFATAGPGQPYEPKPAGMAALATFPGEQPPAGTPTPKP